MNEILIITVDTSFEHGTCEKKKCSNLYLKYVEMKEKFGLHIINEYPIIKTLQQCMGYANMTRLLSGLHTHGSNGTPTARLTIPNGRH